MSVASLAYARPQTQSLDHRVTLNVIQSCVDTLSAKIAKNRPKPTFLTDGADWSKQQRAKKLDKFIAGAFYQMRVFEETPRVFTDSGVFGTGFYKVFSQNGKLCGERANPDEILVDDAEGIYGNPSTVYQNKALERDMLLDLYPEHKVAINAAPRADKVAGMMSNDHGADRIIVTESWHLPTSSDSKDGRHFMGIEGADFVFDEWKRPRFPFATMRNNPKLFGFWGQGTAERLLSLQLEINKLLRSIQLAQHLMSVPRIWLERGSKIIKAHLNNKIGMIGEYSGLKPEASVFQAMSPEVYEHLDKLYQRAFEIEGISQLSAQAKKPAGLDSSVALREYNDIESERFVQVGQRWEYFHMDISRIIIDECRDLMEQDPGFSIVAKGKRGLETIKFKDVDMDDDGVIMQVFPTSGLSSNPAERKQEVQEWMQGGLIDPDEGLALLNLPDLEGYKNLRWAAKDVVKDVVEKMIEDGVFTSPEPYMDLSFAMKYAQMSYNKAKLDGVPEPRLELLRRFMTLADTMIKSPPESTQAPTAAAAAPQGPPPPGPPQGPPGSPPAMPQAPQGPAMPPTAA